ncbi:hypothetical protein C7121_20135 [Paenibacillus glucanolyticus]|uniref:hypothetical protein n=1 Tax=Paenibacillus glucanolyticus TaxID=59843 RepID=UPI00055D589A|nr:hypothetical protein C7121_20135 [Paenibacillus glucanolyticus]
MSVKIDTLLEIQQQDWLMHPKMESSQKAAASFRQRKKAATFDGQSVKKFILVLAALWLVIDWTGSQQAAP